MRTLSNSAKRLLNGSQQTTCVSFPARSAALGWWLAIVGTVAACPWWHLNSLAELSHQPSSSFIVQGGMAFLASPSARSLSLSLIFSFFNLRRLRSSAVSGADAQWRSLSPDVPGCPHYARIEMSRPQEERKSFSQRNTNCSYSWVRKRFSASDELWCGVNECINSEIDWSLWGVWVISTSWWARTGLDPEEVIDERFGMASLIILTGVYWSACAKTQGNSWVPNVLVLWLCEEPNSLRAALSHCSPFRLCTRESLIWFYQWDEHQHGYYSYSPGNVFAIAFSEFGVYPGCTQITIFHATEISLVSD